MIEQRLCALPYRRWRSVRLHFPQDCNTTRVHAKRVTERVLTAAAKTELDVLAVYNDRHSYFLTCKAWAENLEDGRDEIIRRWGETLYRRFRLYLWGSAYAFLSHSMEAFRVVLERPRDA